MPFMDYEKLSISELVGLIARLNNIIEDKRKEQRTELLRDLRQLAEANGYELSDLISGVKRKTGADVLNTSTGAENGTKQNGANEIGAEASVDKAPAGKVFRDPVSGKTWSGRGRRPAWFKPGMGSEDSLT